MSRDFDDIRKKIDQSYKDLDKNQDKILKEITDIKKQVRDIGFKVDMMLEILNNFTIMLSEDDEELEDNYDTYESWVPDEESYYDEDNWSDGEDESW